MSNQLITILVCTYRLVNVLTYILSSIYLIFHPTNPVVMDFERYYHTFPRCFITKVGHTLSNHKVNRNFRFRLSERYDDDDEMDFGCRLQQNGKYDMNE